jgi:dTDP-4-dehydrorhamnose reductase
MRSLILGKNGQLGWELERALAPLGPMVALDRKQCNLDDVQAIPAVLRRYPADVILNAAAYNDVDLAESEPDLARTVNAEAVGVLAAYARDAGQVLIHYSTDYVFDGDLRRPYTEADRPRPISVYGRTKLEGEEAVQKADGIHLILRTSWLYSLRRSSFVTRVLEWSRTWPEVRIAEDQVGSPTWCRTLAQATVHILASGESLRDRLGRRSGVYHVACAGAASRWEWACEILRCDPKPSEQHVGPDSIQRSQSREFRTRAARPAFSALDSTLFQHQFGYSLPPWQEALRAAMRAD